jgi:transcriptional regulator with XRE-family HTH domain
MVCMRSNGTNDAIDGGGPPFASWLALQLRMRRLSHEQLARRSGVHRSTITRLVSGQRRPTLETARRLVAALGGAAEAAILGSAAAPDAADPIARVERALRGDRQLSDDGLRHVMRAYLAARRST